MHFSSKTLADQDLSPPLSGEDERLQCLRSLDLVGQPSNPCIDQLVKSVATYFRVPTAFVSVLDSRMQYFVSSYGLCLGQSRRSVAFCNHTIRKRGIFAVEDASADEAFASNPLVTGYPHIRFYAGAPVIIDRRHAIGSLCVTDRMPRRLKPNENRMLAHFASMLSTMFENQYRDTNWKASATFQPGKSNW